MKMKNSVVVKLILFLCGAAFLAAGGFSTFSPDGFTLRNGIDISNNLGLYNDYRGFGGLMFGMGLVIMLGIIHARIAFTSTVVAAVGYATLTLGRVLSIGIDGMPVEGLLKATIVEGVLALLAIFILVRFKEKP
jgi:hypothetical protein